MPWHPPIPAGRLYSSDALDLGPALAMLIWCYDNVNRDGTIEVQLPQVTTDIGKPYGTIKDWWRMLRLGPFFCEQIDRGKRGWVVRMAEDWIDWHVMANNYPSKSSESRDINLEDVESSVKAASKRRQSRNVNLEETAYKEIQHDQNPTSSSQLETSSDDVDDFVRGLLREFPISRSTARKIALTGADLETVAQSLRNNGDLRDPRSYGKILDRILGAPPEKGKPYENPSGKPPALNGTGPRQEKKNALSPSQLAALAAGETYDN